MKRKNEVVKAADYTEVLTGQYAKVESAKGAFVREAVRFGAMMMEVEGSLSTAVDKLASKRGRMGEGRPNCGLETWLSANCPTINYKTAMSYKSMAAKFSAMLGGGDVAVAALSENHSDKTAKDEVIDIPAEIVEKREALFDEVDSRRKLEQAYFA